MSYFCRKSTIICQFINLSIVCNKRTMV